MNKRYISSEPGRAVPRPGFQSYTPPRSSRNWFIVGVFGLSIFLSVLAVPNCLYYLDASKRASVHAAKLRTSEAENARLKAEYEIALAKNDQMKTGGDYSYVETRKRLNLKFDGEHQYEFPD